MKFAIPFKHSDTGELRTITVDLDSTYRKSVDEVRALHGAEQADLIAEAYALQLACMQFDRPEPGMIWNHAGPPERVFVH